MVSPTEPNANNPASNPAPQLPDALRPGGLVDEVLSRTQEPGWLGHPAGNIKKDMLWDISQIRKNFLETKGSSPDQPPTAEECYRKALPIWHDTRKADPVLRYCLARHEGLEEMSDSLEDA